MSALFLMLGLISGGAGAWWLVKFAAEGMYTARIRELESKLRYSQGETLTLKEQITAVRAQIAAAEKNLTEERAAHTSALCQMAASLKRGILALSAAYFTVGLVFGGTTGWLGASWKLGAHQGAEKSQLEVNAQLAELKVELLKNMV